MSLALFRSLNSPIKKVTLEGKSDLSLLWEEARSPIKSPNPKFTGRKRENESILNMLAALKPQTPTKKLFCPPSILQSPKQIAPKEEDEEKVNNLLYSTVSITTNDLFEIPEEILKKESFVYKGCENQREAWISFKEIAKTTKSGVVACATYAFLFEHGKVTAKAFTGTAQRKLEMESSNLPEISIDKAIDLIDSIHGNEKISIFSSDMFFYSTVTPFNFKRSEFESSNGKRFRVSISGFVFPEQFESLMRDHLKFGLFKISKTVLY